jgi:Signal transduction histidine kinase regulating citrate/malate metabolism
MDLTPYLTPTTIFEELRFILELIAAELIFFLPSSPRKSHFKLRIATGILALCALSFIYFIWVWISERYGATTSFPLRYIFPFWYVFLTFVSLFWIYLSFKTNFTALLFKGVLSYTLQHMEYVLINEVLAIGLYPALRGGVWYNLLLYIVICIISYAGICYLAYRVFKKPLSQVDDSVLSLKKGNTIFYALLLVVLIASSFVFQGIFNQDGTVSGLNSNFLGALEDEVVCSLILLVQASLLTTSLANEQKAISDQLLYERNRQYEASRENIDLINRKCHDLKHQISALKTMSDEERNESISEVEKAVLIYDSGIKTNNPVLNTLLNEKSLYCQGHNITLSCIIDDSNLSCLSTMEIYSLLGNALDNAIESVTKVTDPKKRVISLTIATKNSFLSIQTNNYFVGDLQMINGLPVTTKSDTAYHGYGTKSMLAIVQSHGGDMQIKKENDIFILQIVIPLSLPAKRA